MTQQPNRCRDVFLTWTSSPVRVAVIATAVAAAFVNICVLMTCRLGWLFVEDFINNPSVSTPLLCDIVVDHFVKNRVFELACGVTLVLLLVLLAFNARPQLFVAFTAACVFIATISACVTSLSWLTMLTPLVDHGL